MIASAPKFDYARTSDLGSMAALTNSEVRVITLLARGLTTKEIAAALGVSPHTVSNHRKNVCKKCDLHSTAELLVFAVSFRLDQRDYGKPARSVLDLGRFGAKGDEK